MTFGLVALATGLLYWELAGYRQRIWHMLAITAWICFTWLLLWR